MNKIKCIKKVKFFFAKNLHYIETLLLFYIGKKVQKIELFDRYFVNMLN
jgi:hypothetical protein